MTVTVRPGEVDDVPALTAIYNHYVTHTHITFDVEEFTPEQRRATWFDHYAPTGRHRLLVAVDSGEVVGYATSSRFRDKPAYATSVEATVYCHPDVIARGVGSALYTALFEVLAGEEVHRAYAGVALPNDTSLALHRRFGFAGIGVFEEVGFKFGRYWDVLWLQLTL